MRKLLLTVALIRLAAHTEMAHAQAAAPQPATGNQTTGSQTTGASPTTGSASNPASQATAPGSSSGTTASSIGTAPAPGGASTPAHPAATMAAGPQMPLSAGAMAVKPGHYRLDPEHGKITWSVNHLGFSTYAGLLGTVTADLTVDPKNVAATTLTATVDTGSVATLNAKLDENVKGPGFLDVKQWPQATFKSTKVTVTGPQTARIDGDLTLRGKSAPIVISATFNNAGIDPVDKQYTVGFDGASIIRRSTYGVSQYVPLVGDNVLLRIEGEFKRAP